MRVDGNYGATKGYEPNSYGEWKDSPHMKEPPLKASGNGEIYNYNEREYDDDYYSQPGDLFRLMPADEQQLLFENTARAMGDSNYSLNSVTPATATKQIPHTVPESPKHWVLICKKH